MEKGGIHEGFHTLKKKRIPKSGKVMEAIRGRMQARQSGKASETEELRMIYRGNRMENSEGQVHRNPF